MNINLEEKEIELLLKALLELPAKESLNLIIKLSHISEATENKNDTALTMARASLKENK